ncbi:hypothetical protein F4703DRAFT_1796831 [Phycomyces blakesleeanus]
MSSRSTICPNHKLTKQEQVKNLLGDSPVTFTGKIKLDTILRVIACWLLVLKWLPPKPPQLLNALRDDHRHIYLAAEKNFLKSQKRVLFQKLFNNIAIIWPDNISEAYTVKKGVTAEICEDLLRTNIHKSVTLGSLSESLGAYISMLARIMRNYEHQNRQQKQQKLQMSASPLNPNQQSTTVGKTQQRSNGYQQTMVSTTATAAPARETLTTSSIFVMPCIIAEMEVHNT